MKVRTLKYWCHGDTMIGSHPYFSRFLAMLSVILEMHSRCLVEGSCDPIFTELCRESLTHLSVFLLSLTYYLVPHPESRLTTNDGPSCFSAVLSTTQICVRWRMKALSSPTLWLKALIQPSSAQAKQPGLGSSAESRTNASLIVQCVTLSPNDVTYI